MKSAAKAASPRKPVVSLPAGFSPVEQVSVTLDLDTVYQNLCSMGAGRSTQTACGLKMGAVIHGISIAALCWEHPFVLYGEDSSGEKVLVSRYPIVHVASDGRVAPEGTPHHVMLRFRARLYSSIVVGEPEPVSRGSKFRLCEKALPPTSEIEIFRSIEPAEPEVKHDKKTPASIRKPAMHRGEVAIAA